MKRMALVALIVLAASPAIAASSPFGIGLMEQAPTGPLAFLLAWQSSYYKAMTAAIRSIATGSWQGFFTLVSLSTAYGVFHAAGPGHGKAVISSYVLTNRQSVWRGVQLSLASALAQAIVAIGLVSLLAYVFGTTAIVMTNAARGMELAAYAMVIALGVYMVSQKVVRPLWRWHKGTPLDEAEVPACCDFHRLNGLPQAKRPRAVAQSRFQAIACEDPPAPKSQLRSALTSILSVGLRPCTGALIVLVFAKTQGIFLAGIVSVLAMGLGTAVTVAVLATFAISARATAERLAARDSHRLVLVTRAAEAIGALIVLIFGVAMFGVSLN